MNRKTLFASLLTMVLLSAAGIETRRLIQTQPPHRGNRPTEYFGPSVVQARLNVDIDSKTDQVHFVRDDADPEVYTRAYILKHADPFIMRGLLKVALTSSTSDRAVGVDSLRYHDGTGIILVSAEENLFRDAGGSQPRRGTTIDELVESLDKSNLPNSSGTVEKVYFAKYNAVSTLADSLRNSGMGFSGASKNESTDGLTGSEEHNMAFAYDPIEGLRRDVRPLTYLTEDRGVNALVLSASGYNMAEIIAFLSAIDVPLREVHLTFKLVEVYAENDQKLGLDFQAWKNNDGLDFFAAGGRYGTNWSSAGLTTGMRPTSEFYHFNPKWNTKYLDFLTTKSKARVVSGGTLTIADGKSAELVFKDGLFAIENRNATTTVDNTIAVPVSKSVTAGIETVNYKYVSVENIQQGHPLTDDLPRDGKTKGQTLWRDDLPAEALDHQVGEGQIVDVKQASDADIEEANGNYFRVKVSGGVHQEACDLTVDMLSFSVVGWDSNGKARTSRSANTTKIQVGNNGKEFVIGGITKTALVRSVSGVPFLKDLPVLGWLFSTETDTVKKSQFVLVATAKVVQPDSVIEKAAKEKLNDVESKIKRAEEAPAKTAGYQQLKLDTKSWKEWK